MAQEKESMTVDDLAAIYRMEVKSKALSDIRKDLYPAIAKLSGDVRREYEEELKKDSNSIFSEGLNERRKKIQLHSRNIIELRMEKITKLALLGAMGGDNSVDHLTKEEKEYYTCVLEASKRHHSLIEPQRAKVKPTVLNVEPEKVAESPIIIEEPEEIVHEAIKEETEGSMMIRVLEDLPKFSGPDRDYDLRKEDVVKMPAVMAKALIMREKAVKIDIKS